MKKPLQLKSITFKAGPSPGANALVVPTDSVVVLVGPNNSGKSATLREIESWAYGEETDRKLIESVEIQRPRDAQAALRLVQYYKSSTPAGYGPPPPDGFYTRHFTFRSPPGEVVRQFPVSLNEYILIYTNRNFDALRRLLYSFYTVRLDGRGRFTLVDAKDRGDLVNERPNNHLWALFVDKSSQVRVSELAKEAFGYYFIMIHRAERLCVFA